MNSYQESRNFINWVPSNCVWAKFCGIHVMGMMDGLIFLSSMISLYFERSTSKVPHSKINFPICLLRDEGEGLRKEGGGM